MRLQPKVVEGCGEACPARESCKPETVSCITSTFWGFPYSVVWYKKPDIPDRWIESADTSS